jgi:hypothetical protein
VTEFAILLHHRQVREIAKTDAPALRSERAAGFAGRCAHIDRSILAQGGCLGAIDGESGGVGHELDSERLDDAEKRGKPGIAGGG